MPDNIITETLFPRPLSGASVTDLLNNKSREAAIRLGFRFEGIFHNHMIFKDQNRDTAWYSILDDEWPEVRGITQAWLSADNFDADRKSPLTVL